MKSFLALFSQFLNFIFKLSCLLIYFYYRRAIDVTVIIANHIYSYYYYYVIKEYIIYVYSVSYRNIYFHFLLFLKMWNHEKKKKNSWNESTYCLKELLNCWLKSVVITYQVVCYSIISFLLLMVIFLLLILLLYCEDIHMYFLVIELWRVYLFVERTFIWYTFILPDRKSVV